MKILVITNISLNQEKFHIQNKLLFSSAKELNIELKIKTNADIFYHISQNNIDLEDFDAVLFYDKDIFLCRKLEDLGYKVFNSSECILNCDNKALTYEILAKNHLPIPKTYVLPLMFYYEESFVLKFVENLENNLTYPLVAKKWFGSEGKQVFLIKNRVELFNLIEQERGKELLFQEFFDECSGKDVRIVVINGNICASMKRESLNGDFRSNLSNGGTAKNYTPSTEENNIAISASKALNCNFCGVDILQTKNGPVICEVNSNAHLKNIYDITGINVAKNILNYIQKQIKN